MYLPTFSFAWQRKPRDHHRTMQSNKRLNLHLLNFTEEDPEAKGIDGIYAMTQNAIWWIPDSARQLLGCIFKSACILLMVPRIQLFSLITKL